MSPSYEVGYALSGGFIKGFAHLGAVQALAEHGIHPQIIAGTSAGALAGAFLADGNEPYRCLDYFRGETFRHLTRLALTSSGLLSLEPFVHFLKENIKARRIEELQIPLLVVATDLDHGRSVTFGEGELLPCVIASCSVPVLFMPRQIDGVNYVDGGVLKNFPATTLRPLCDTLIGINASPMVAEDYKLGLVSVALRSYHFMMKANILHDKEVCDLLVEPVDMGNYDTFDVGKGREIFEVGYASTKALLTPALLKKVRLH